MSRTPRTVKAETSKAETSAAEPVRHIPVLLDEVLARSPSTGRDWPWTAPSVRAATPAPPRCRTRDPGDRIDRDPTAIRAGAGLVDASAGGRLRLVQGCFGELDTLIAQQGDAQADWVVLDIGVSSMQLDEAQRGFSFRQDGPLDMRMGNEGPSAADLVNGEEESRLADILYHFGEERRSRAVARAIVEARRRAPIETTAQLADLIAGVVRPEPGSPIHPATRSFQGLRIAVNDELGELVRGLHAAERVLKPGGRLAVVTFHSLEDRIVKQFFSPGAAGRRRPLATCRASSGRRPGASSS
jgi:16S rRNA (cytosine1402-N4)-methyltransferase